MRKLLLLWVILLLIYSESLSQCSIERKSKEFGWLVHGCVKSIYRSKLCKLQQRMTKCIVNQHETAMGALSPDGIGRLTADLRPKANVPLFVSKPRSPCFAILDRPCIVILTVFTLQHDSFNRIALLCDFMFSAVLKTFPSPVYRIFSSSKEEKIQQFLN